VRKCENLPRKLQNHHEPGKGGASIGDRLALDDSAIDGHTKMETSAKVEISHRAGGNAAPSVSIFAETSITHECCDQAKETIKGVERSNEQRAGDR